MALVKTSDLSNKAASQNEARSAAMPGVTSPGTTHPASNGAESRSASAQRRNRDRSRARQQQAAERIEQATQELANGIAEAASAAEELGRSLEQIASAAEQAAGASHQSHASIAALNEIFGRARAEADQSRRQTAELQTFLVEVGAQIDMSIIAIEANAARQLASVNVTAALEQQALNVSEITRAVRDVSDQTSLLALNAAIEAARAGQHGSGFAVVADEVRALAENSEKSARNVQTLSEEIAGELRAIASRIKAAAAIASDEAARSRQISAELNELRSEMSSLSEASQNLLMIAMDAEASVREAQQGAEQIASAAEEQSAAALQAQQAVQEQGKALDQSQQTSQALAALAQNITSRQANGEDTQTKSRFLIAEQVGSAAEELSSNVQQLSGAAGQIMSAVEQISKGAQLQASATLQANVAMAQIERLAGTARGHAEKNVQQIADIGQRLQGNRLVLISLIEGASGALKETRSLAELTASLVNSARSIEKIVDGIGLIAVQTSMLAVTGSVEAARAGEFGRGFAVVSGDIRTLSRDAAENAGRIKDVVHEIQDQISVVRMDLEQIAIASEGESRKNHAVIDRLKSVEEGFVTLRLVNQGVLDGTASILEAVQQVSTGTSQIAAMAEASGSAAMEAAAAARQQARNAEDLAAAIEEIALITDELQSMEG